MPLPALRRVSVAALVLALAGPARAQQSPAAPVPAPIGATADSAPLPGDPRPSPIRREDTRKDAPWKSFSDVTKGAQVQTGLFTLYQKRHGHYLGLTPDQFDRDYLLVTQLSQGIGELGLDGGASVRSDLVRFHRAGDRVELWVVNPHVVATPGTPMARTVAGSFGHSVAQSFPIATVRDTSEILLDLTPFLLSDWADLGATLQGVAAQRKVGGAVSLDRDRSSVGTVRLFPTNLEAAARLTYAATRNLGLETVPDYRWIAVGVHYSLLELPAVPMRPRYADQRVGYFVSAVKDFSRDTADNFFVRFVNRWRLEKRDPDAPVSEPVTPITYYLDHTVPHEWRPYVRAGILEWNRAFEEAGFRNAIRVLEAPDDTLWSAEDARYSTVRWTATQRSVYAIGPSNVDPRTGEILNADILIAASWIPTWRGDAGEYLPPQVAVRSAFVEDSLLAAGADPTRLCRLAEGFARTGMLARATIGSGAGDGAGGLPRAYIGQALKALVMHEIGHTLGLRHNFRGSAGVTGAQLADPGHTARHGIGVSVMDYSPPVLALDPRHQGDFYAPTIGSYDRWAIRYGYAQLTEEAAPEAKGAEAVPPLWIPELEMNGLRAIAAEASAPSHLYGSDEDAGFGRFGIDPTIARYDQTDDPLSWARGRVALINRLFDSLETRIVRPGQGYEQLRRAFADLLSDRWYAMMVATKYVGGATTARDHRGDPGARPALVPVPADRQREALAFVAEAGFREASYRFRPELLTRLAPNRWSHWGSSGSAERIDFPLHDWAQAQAGALLNQLLDPVVLDRIRGNELRTPPGEPVFTLPELFRTLTTAVWAEVGEAAERRSEATRNIGSVRRDLQRLYLNRLVQLVVSPPSGVPEDARALARATLADLRVRLDRTLDRSGRELDDYTRAHLVDSRERIGRALDAGMVEGTATGLR